MPTAQVATVLYEYIGASDEIDAEAGDKILVDEIRDDGWSIVYHINSQIKGRIPTAYFELTGEEVEYKRVLLVPEKKQMKENRVESNSTRSEVSRKKIKVSPQEYEEIKAFLTSALQMKAQFSKHKGINNFMKALDAAIDEANKIINTADVSELNH
jgi:hypothetical protein